MADAPRKVARRPYRPAGRNSEARRLYYTAAWRRIRATHLAGSPLCVACMREGRPVNATDVDHVSPHKGKHHIFYDANNLQSLCHACHSRKTATEDGGFGRVRHNEAGEGKKLPTGGR